MIRTFLVATAGLALGATLGLVSIQPLPPVDSPATLVASMEPPVLLGHDVFTRVAGPTSPASLSPAGCKIVYVTDAHPAESVPGAVKVNVKSQCGAAVPELDLSVTLLVDGRPAAKTVSKAVNKAYLLNQSTYVRCKNFTDTHTFQGTALGTSFENDGDGGQKPYTQIKTGRAVPLKCGI